MQAALVFTDIVDSTSTTQRLGDERAAALWAEHDRRARTLLGRHRGREAGRSDGFQLTFEAAADAAAFALDYHREIVAIGLGARAGIHVGPVSVRAPSGDALALGAKAIEIDGLALAIASRVMAMAGRGQTLLTAAAFGAMQGLPGDGTVQVHRHGHYRLKGIDEPVEILEIGVVPQCNFASPPDAEKSYRVALVGDVWQPVGEVPHRLPAERDAFVGRGTDLAEIDRHFDSGARLLTLMGPGGTGKTRLAIRYGRGRLGDWPGGVWFCDLSDASSLEGIHYAVARALGVRVGAGDPAIELAEAIAARGRCLVVLDNFEQVAAHAAATVGGWLDAAQAAGFIVTSRERLGLPGEVVQQVEPLPLDRPAVDLFVVRAKAVRSGFALDDETRGIVSDVVRLLDGLPLAIELAAARIALLSPAQLLSRLRDRFELLGGRRGPGRQATLRAAIDWSWQLLSAPEQAALAQCAAFEGGFTLAAAEAVLDLSAWPDAPSVIDTVQSLVDKSLLRRWMPDAAGPRHQLGEPYFGMYISIREYATAKCRERGADYERALFERHGRYFAAFGTDEALEALATHGGVERQHVLRRELDNLMAACRRAAARGDGETAVACYRAAWEVLALQGPFSAALALGEDVLAIAGLDVRLAELARLTQGEALTRVGATEGLEASYRRALDRVRATGDRMLEGRILGRLGNVCLWAGRTEEAHEHYAAALACAREVGHALLEARMHGNLAIACHERGRIDEARTHYEAALAIERAIGSRRDEAITLCNYADLLRGQGEIARARAQFATSLQVLREIGDRDTEAITLQQLGELELDCELYAESAATSRSAVDLASKLGNRRMHAYALRTLAQALMEQRDGDGARLALDQALALTRSAPNRRIEAQLIATLGELAFREGRNDDAAARLADAEATLREQDEPPLLAELLCVRGLVDIARGDRESAASALGEAERIAEAMHAGAATGLGRRIERLRRLLATRA